MLAGAAGGKLGGKKRWKGTTAKLRSAAKRKLAARPARAVARANDPPGGARLKSIQFPPFLWCLKVTAVYRTQSSARTRSMILATTLRPSSSPISISLRKWMPPHRREYGVLDGPCSNLTSVVWIKIRQHFRDRARERSVIGGVARMIGRRKQRVYLGIELEGPYRPIGVFGIMRCD